MSSYAWLLLLDAARAAVVVLAAFVWLPLWALPRLTPGPRGHRMWGGLLAGSAAAIALVHGLAVLNLYDGLVLLLALVALALAAVLWRRYRAFDRNAVGTLLADSYVRLLRYADGERHARTVRPLRRRGWRRRLRGWPGAVLVLLLASALLRLEPLMTQVGPFSMQYYATLEAAKLLERDTLYYGLRPEARGLHALMLAVHALSRVELSVLTQIFGAFSGVAVVYGLYHAVRGATGRPSAAFAGAALFGLGSAWLPFGLERQVEAAALLLAVALALPAFFFAGQYLVRGSRRTLGMVVAGTAAAVLTSFTVGALLAAGLLGLALGGWAIGSIGRRTRRVASVGIAAGALLGAGAAYLQFGYVPAGNVAPRFTVHEGMLAFGTEAPALWMQAGAGGLGLLLILAAFAAENHARRFGRAVAGIALPALVAARPAVPLDWQLAVDAGISVAGCAAVGMLLAAFFAASQRYAHRLGAAAQRGRRFGRRWGPAAAAVLAVGFAVAGGFTGREPLQADFTYTVEPPGFVEAMQQLERTLSPYQWTVVSHYGTGVRAMNRGQFMDYPYFLENYDPRRYDHTSKEAIPTPDLLIFVEKDFHSLHVLDELLPPGDDLMREASEWCRIYDEAHQRGPADRQMTIFYETDEVRVCRLSRSVRPPRRAGRNANAQRISAVH